MDDEQGRDDELEALRRELAREREGRAARVAGLRALVEAVAHDVPAPLRATRLHLEILRRRHGDALGEPGREAVGLAIAAAAEGQQRLRELVELLRIETDEVRPEPVDLGRAAADVVRALGARLSTLGAQVDVRELPVVWADPGLVRKLLRHALEDALDQRVDDVPLQVRLSARTGPGGEAVIEVADDGREVDDARALTLPFHRRGPARVDATGLGLAAVERLAQRLGGRLEVEPGPVGGLVVRVTLPTPSR